MTPRRVLRIARLEVSTAIGGTDRRAAVAILLVLAVLGGMVPVIAGANPTPGEGLYRVGVEPSSPYYEPVSQDPRLRVVSPADRSFAAGEVEVRITGETVRVHDTETGRAAAMTVRDAVVEYNDRQMANEPDDVAAFPVVVTLRYASRDTPQTDLLDAVGADTTDGSNDGRTTAPSETTDETDSQDGQTDGGTVTTTDESGETTAESGDSDGTIVGDDETTTATGGADDSDAATPGNGDDGPFAGLLGTTQSGTPASISPPFPLRSLLLAFAFLLPFNVIIQAYGGSVFGERINRRGEPLLVSPASRTEIVLGKTLPYFALAMGITAIIAVAVGGGIRTIAAIAPLAALFLGSTFVAALLARSYKELTFLTVTISVVLTAYAFVPAVFTNVHPIASISPLTVVVDDLQSAPFSFGPFVLATLPVALAAGVVFVLGTGMYREEHLFARRPLPTKIIDALAEPLDAPWRVGLWTALFVPFVFVAELFVVAVLFVIPASRSIPLVLGAVAVIEEVAKSIHIYAGFERGRFQRTGRWAVTLGVLSGVGFFVAEKLMAITQLVGLPGLDVGRVAFGPEIGGLSPGVLLLAPLLLHVTTASISAQGAARSRRAYLGGLVLAILVHVGYNLAVVSLVA